MATRFEAVLYGDRPEALRAAAEEAFAEIDRLEAQLSLYRPTSELSFLNAHAAEGPVTVEPSLFRLLQRAQTIHRSSAGAFDITVGPLMRCWGLMGGSGSFPDSASLAHARSVVGMHLVDLDPLGRTVRFARPGVTLDLGSIGKGFALERALGMLEEAGVTSALLHGGTSTICALGAPPDSNAWRIALEHPAVAAQDRSFHLADPVPQRTGAEAVLAVVNLRDESLSVSAVWGKGFQDGGRIYGHVLDPRTGEPVQSALLAAVVLPSATDSDAWSTALLNLGEPGHELIAQEHPRSRSYLVAPSQEPGRYRFTKRD